MNDQIEQQREHFNEISGLYLKGKQNPRFLILQDLIWKELFGLLPDDFKSRKISVLEPMCGYAEGYELFVKFGYDIDYSGFDYSEAIVNNVNESKPNLNVFHCDVTEFKSSQKFDIILIIGGLHHVPDHAGQIVKKLSLMLEDGGVFINFEPTHGNPFSKMIRTLVYQGNKIFDEKTERDFSLTELKEFYTEAGLLHCNSLFPGLLTYVLYYNPYAFPFLNIGTINLVKRIFMLERPLFYNKVGQLLSFCTMSIWTKQP